MDDDEVQTKAQDLKALRLILPFLWPRNDPSMRWRLVLSLVLLGVTAAMNAGVPILFSRAVDALAVKADALVVAPVALLISYGLMQWVARVLNEGRWLYYGPIELRLHRTVALTAFKHVNELSQGLSQPAVWRQVHELEGRADSGRHAVNLARVRPVSVPTTAAARAA